MSAASEIAVCRAQAGSLTCAPTFLRYTSKFTVSRWPIWTAPHRRSAPRP